MKKYRLFILLLLFSCNTEKNISVRHFDIVVYGGTSSGVITAYAARMMGRSVLLIHPGNRLGGLSAGGLGLTDIGNKHAVTGLAREFYRRLGDHYGRFESWKFEPGQALRVFLGFIENADIPVIYNHCLTGIEKENNRIQSIQINSTDPVRRVDLQTISGRIFIDCSYEGDLMAMAGISYTIGREANTKYGETYNGVQMRETHQFPDGVDPYVVPGNPESGLLWGISDEALAPEGNGDYKVQAYNFRICLTNDPENLIPITRPENYDSTKYELLVRLFEAQPEKRKLGQYFSWDLMPNHKTDLNNNGGFSTDMIGASYEYPEADWVRRKQIIDDHVDYTRGLLYFYKNDPRVPPELQEEISHWGYPADEYIENDNWTPQLYIREARRMIGAHVMTEHHCTGDSVAADPVALAAYTMDSHNCQRIVVDGMVKNEGDVQVGGFPPYPISYRSLLPVREECDNLIVPVCLSASHIAFGSIRMEPVFMVLGQISAIAASLSIERNSPVQDVDHNAITTVMNRDPLLDGTPPDITVDNEDPGVKFKGNWVTETHFMRNYKNSLMALDRPGPSDYFEFTVRADTAAKYDAYFYCPIYIDENSIGKQVGNVILEVNHEDGKNDIEVEYDKNTGGWAWIGQYSLEKGRSYPIRVRPGKNTGFLVADAVLLVPVRN